MIRRLISSLTGRAKSASVSAGGGSSSLPSSARDTHRDDDVRIANALARHWANEEKKARYRAQFDREC